MPGALGWSWSVIGPFYRSGAAASEGAALLAALPLPALPCWSRAELRTAGVDEAAECTVVAVLDSYHRSNATNLALTALRLALERRAEPRLVAAAVAAGGPPPVEGQLPVLLTLTDMTPATAELIRELDRFGERGEVRIPASMYRHLAHWPGFLADRCSPSALSVARAESACHGSERTAAQLHAAAHGPPAGARLA